MKRFLAPILALACLVFASGLWAQANISEEREPDLDGSPAVHRSLGDAIFGGSSDNWRARALSRQISVGAGVWRAYWAAVTYEGGNGQNYIFDPTYLVSAGAKYFFNDSIFSYFGIGLDGVLMETHKESYDAFRDSKGEDHPAGTTTISQWLLDINLYGRYPLIKILNLMAGAGITCSYVDMGSKPNTTGAFNAAGWNAKLGVEFFVVDVVSLTFFATYHSFNKGATIGGIENQNAHVKLTSFALMCNYYL